MAYLAMLFFLFFLVGLGVRIVLHRRRTGASGVHSLSKEAGLIEVIGGGLFLVGATLGLIAPMMTVLGVLDPIAALDRMAINIAGIALFAVGFSGVNLSQSAMGSSWRVGVDPDESLDLVTAGPFEYVRNPIYASMLTAAMGLVLIVPNALALVAFSSLTVSIEIQTRFVEEPYLIESQGVPYSRYAARVGRFILGIGRIRSKDRL